MLADYSLLYINFLHAQIPYAGRLQFPIYKFLARRGLLYLQYFSNSMKYNSELRSFTTTYHSLWKYLNKLILHCFLYHAEFQSFMFNCSQCMSAFSSISLKNCCLLAHLEKKYKISKHIECLLEHFAFASSEITLH